MCIRDRPYLVENVKNIDGGVIKETKASKLSEPLEASECETLKKMLRKVVTKGTGTRAYSSHYNVYGKTGSAEYNLSLIHIFYQKKRKKHLNF